MSITRRTFVKGALVGGATLATGGLSVLSGCAPVSPAPLVETSVDDNGLIVVPVPRYPQLQAVGGAVTLRFTSAPANPATFTVPTGGILLIHRSTFADPPEYVAVASSCPHLGCPLGYSPDDQLIKCPCHASEFLPVADPSVAGSCTGTVVHLPAVSNLRAWPVTYDATTQSVTVDLKGNPCAAPPSNACPAVANGQVVIDLTAVPALQTVGGQHNCAPQGLGDTLILIRTAMNKVTVLSDICTHQACNLAYSASNNDLECPCHQSRYSLTGALTQPNSLGDPQGTQLKVYPATLSGNTLTIQVA